MKKRFISKTPVVSITDEKVLNNYSMYSLIDSNEDERTELYVSSKTIRMQENKENRGIFGCLRS